MIPHREGKHFYIFDYFLDGYFLKWEEVEGNCLTCGEFCSISLEDGTKINAQVVETEEISENEMRIFLSSKREAEK